VKNPGERLVIGLVSGSSVDGVDAGLVKITGTCEESKIELLHFECLDFDDETRSRVLDLFHYENATVDKLAELHAIMGELFAEAALLVAEKHGTPMAEVDAIGAWGQMMYHLPAATNPFEWRGRKLGASLQMCDLSRVALRTGVPTVGDIAAGDIAAGGNGAPFTALFDYLMYHDPNLNRSVQNIGGIGNCNLIPAEGGLAKVVGFDTGPGNMVIDGLVRHYTGGKEHFDKDGERAARGAVNQELLDQLLTDKFIQQDPPKAAGRENYGAHFVRWVLELAEPLGVSEDDVVATATALTAEAIALNYRRHLAPVAKVDEIICGGGGARNVTLLRMIAERTGAIVKTHEDYGIPSFALETMDVALIANETSLGHPNHIPWHTGGKQQSFAGVVAPAPGRPLRTS
jgi:anhydro-N-acetylmuramic acid kinase